MSRYAGHCAYARHRSDANGVLVTTTAATITFAATGAGELAAVGSGDPADTASFHLPSRLSYRGKAVAILRPGGENKAPTAGTITLSASAVGLKGASIEVIVATS